MCISVHSSIRIRDSMNIDVHIVTRASIYIGVLASIRIGENM